MAFIQLAIAILATYRLALLLPEDDGPFFVFRRIRLFLQRKATIAYCKKYSYADEDMEIAIEPNEVSAAILLSDENDDLGIWTNLFKGAMCPYCCGLYAAVLVFGLVFWQNIYGNAALLIIAFAGGQSLLQKWGEKR